jgi:cell shape-determining protein MreC
VSGVSEERLERVKAYWKYRNSANNVTTRDIKWLIEQAERVEESERLLKEYQTDWTFLVPKLTGLEEENKRLREALKFYANKDNYNPTNSYRGNGHVETLEPEICFDEGHEARKTLEEST